MAEPQTIKIAPMVPIDHSATSWTRFINAFEVAEFTGWIDESVSWKKTCYIGDWSQALKLRIRGPEAKAFLEFISTNHWPNLKRHQAKHSIMCRDDGNIMGEGLIMMLDQNDYIFTSGPGIPWALFQAKHGRRKFDIETEIVSDDWYLLQIQGPKSHEVLEAATGESIRDLKFLDAKEMSIGELKFLALRQGVSGERGYELWGPSKDGQSVYKAILAAGEKFGIRQLGMRTKLVNHAEAAVPTPVIDFLPAVFGEDPEVRRYAKFLEDTKMIILDYSALKISGSYSSKHEDYQRDPYDLGWDRIVNFDHDFIGKEALQSVAANPPNKFVALEWNSEDVTDVFASLFRDKPYEYMEMPRYQFLTASSVYIDGTLVGSATSRCYSYSFKRTISHGIIDRRYSKPGTQVEIKWGSEGYPQKIIRAVVKQAPYKEDQRRKKIPQI
ncbi:glycine cleavage T protein [Diaporthe sp. PMI_573]|nr:glycine cleavage T protein [Diaporthaceae sp. PMI_573]